MLDIILYRGSACEVKLITYSGRDTHVIFREQKLLIYFNNKLSDSKQLQERICILNQWMIERAHEVIKKRTEELAAKIGVKYNSIRIKDTKTRWGSCSSKGNLNFNFRLVMAPEAVMDYIIIHELCHLLHMNHSKDFWDAVARYMPEYELHKEWLKKNAVKLYQI